MASGGSPDLKSYVLELEERLKQAEESRRQAEERTQPTTFEELMRFCHTLLSLPLKVGELPDSTKGEISTPTGKFCPTRLELS
jgi:topoisomerase IA-like protein